MERQVLDHGFVRLVERMGGDGAVVQAARVSFDSGSKGEEKDKRLIDFLIRHGHGTPFEHACLKFHVACPVFVARQWFRHRLGSFDERWGEGLIEDAGHSINEVSYRYTEVEDRFYVPAALRAQARDDRQASREDDFADEAALIELVREAHEFVYARYRKLLAAGVARELARGLLPLNTYTQFYWTCNARSLMHFLKLRADAHAQSEIRAYAEAVARVFKASMPWTFQSFLAHVWTGKNPLLEDSQSA